LRQRIGYEMQYQFPRPTPVILMLNVHFTRVSDLAAPDHIIISPSVPISGYRDGFGNWCSRIVAPAGRVIIAADAIVSDSGLPDPSFPDAIQVPVEQLPEETLVFLLASRFCDSDQLLDLAWTLFGHAKPGWSRVQAICDFVHQRITFGYQHASATRKASEAYETRIGVCRDYAHLAVAFCRALNIPARYCTGYLGDVGTPPPYPPGDFAAWFEAFVGGSWYTFDPRNNVPRIGRVLIARGRDAADVAISTTFGPNTLEGFRVWTDEINPRPVDRTTPQASVCAVDL
jgi:transglutaminase-like putative cysteine protease